MKFAVVINKQSKFIDKVVRMLENLQPEHEFVRLEDLPIYPKFMQKEPAGAKFLLVFGGDGTILYASKLALKWQLPILGINMGRLGFLSEIALEDFRDSLAALVAGDFKVQKRMLLDVAVMRSGEEIARRQVLNDAVIYRAHNAKLIEFEVYNNQDFVYQARADGVLMSTPTGTTGYNLSIGGPILNPTMDSVVINAINPHLLTVRPIVFFAEDSFEFRVKAAGKESTLQLDGANLMYLQNGDSVFLTKSSQKAEFIKLGKTTFFQTMQNKFHMGKKNG